MIEYKSELIKILSLKNLDELQVKIDSVTKLISEKDLSGFFIESIYLKSVLELIVDDHRRQSQHSDTALQYERFIKPYLSAELKPLLYIHYFFQNSNIEGLRTALNALTNLVGLLLKSIESKSTEFQKIVLKNSLQKMSEFFELEHQQNYISKKNNSDGRLSLYGAFDILDKIFELDHLQSENPSIVEMESLSESTRLGTQSSYATIVLALKYVNLAKGSKLIDLGSSYGRSGLVLGLMRPDVHYTGLEFVRERVGIASAASARLQLEQHVQFVTQDLAQADFKIPLADTYFIFDSFTELICEAIVDQLQKLTLQKKITVVTKGNAKPWMKNNFWMEPQEFNEGNLCIFRSRAMPRGI